LVKLPGRGVGPCDFEPMVGREAAAPIAKRPQRPRNFLSRRPPCQREASGRPKSRRSSAASHASWLHWPSAGNRPTVPARSPPPRCKEARPPSARFRSHPAFGRDEMARPVRPPLEAGRPLGGGWFEGPATPGSTETGNVPCEGWRACCPIPSGGFEFLVRKEGSNRQLGSFLAFERAGLRGPAFLQSSRCSAWRMRSPRRAGGSSPRARFNDVWSLAGGGIDRLWPSYVNHLRPRYALVKRLASARPTRRSGFLLLRSTGVA